MYTKQKVYLGMDQGFPEAVYSRHGRNIFEGHSNGEEAPDTLPIPLDDCDWQAGVINIIRKISKLKFLIYIPLEMARKCCD